MISRKTVIEYFSEILKEAKAMREAYGRIAGSLKDPDAKAFFSVLEAEEKWQIELLEGFLSDISGRK